MIAADALAETHRPQMISTSPRNPATSRAGWYGLGWNVNYDDQGRILPGHSGAFNLGASTAVSLLPAEQIGIVALTNGKAACVLIENLNIHGQGTFTRKA